jgi:hypothetical protein
MNAVETPTDHHTGTRRPDCVPHVLFFDYWTKGAFHFTQLMREVEPGQANFTLLHLGSWRDPSVPSRQEIEGLECMDIASFKRWNLRKILRFLQPTVVVGLNMHSLCDRALFLACRRAHIPTVFLQHGAWADPDNFATAAAEVDRGCTLWDRMVRAPKVVRTLRWYFSSRPGSAQ